MANKKALKDRKKKIKEDANRAGGVAEQPANRVPFEAPVSDVSTAIANASVAYTEVSTQMAPPQQSANTSSPLRLVPIYDLNHLPIDSTGYRFIPQLEKSSVALQNMRLIPIYPQNPSADILNAPSTNDIPAGPGSVPTNPNGNGGVSGTSPQQNGVSSSLQQSADLPTNANVLESKGNSNTQVYILPPGLPPMVPVMGDIRRGPGTKISLEDNEDTQILLAPRASVEQSPLTSGEEITFKRNKKMQLFSGGGGGASSENIANDSNDESDGAADDTTRDRSHSKAKASVEVSNNTSSQIMGIPSAGAPGTSSNISNNQNSQIMHIPQLPQYRPPTSPAYAAPTAPNVQPPVQPIAAPPLRAAGSGNSSRASNYFGLLYNQFRERVWHANKALKSIAGSVNSKITLSKPTTDGFPRLKKRCVLKCTDASGRSQECVVDVYESRLRIRSISEDNQLPVELNFSDIKGIKSTSSQHLDLTDQDDIVTSFSSDDSTADDIIDIVSGIVSAVHSAYPEVSFESLVPVFEVSPEDRYSLALVPYKNSPQHHNESSVGPHVTSGVPPGIRTFSLADFYRRFPNGDIGLLKALKYSKWFIRLNADSEHVTLACVECIAEILEYNTTLEVLDFSQARLKPFSVQKLALALSRNPASKVVEINFSNNALSKTDVEALSAALAMPNRGFKGLYLEKTGITARLTNELLRGIHNNTYASTLRCLNLSGLRSDFFSHFRRNNSIQSVGVFLGSKNKLQELNLSGGGMVLEEIVDSLAEGCLSDLRVLELSGNYYSLENAKPVPKKWKRFFSEARSIDMIGFSNTRLPESALKELFEGLSENTFIAERSTGVSLDVSRNNLGTKGARVLADIAGQMQNIRSLDITRNGLKNGLSIIFDSYAAHGGVKELLIGKNFNFLTQHRTFKQIGAKVPRILEEDARKKEQAVEALIRMIQSDESVVTSLDISSSNLGSDTSRIIDSLGKNMKITRLNISGNDMGDDGAAALAAMLLANKVLKSISFDRNNLSVNGLERIAQVLWRNPALKEVALPSVDISTAHWENHVKAFELAQIFKLKNCSANDLQSTARYCSLACNTAEHHEGASSSEYAQLTGETDNPGSSVRRTGNDGLSVDLTNDGLRDRKKVFPINRNEIGTTSQTVAVDHALNGSSSQTVAIVHSEFEGQSKDYLSNENQAENAPDEAMSAPTLPEKRRQRDLPSIRSGAFSLLKKGSKPATAASDNQENRSATNKETIFERNGSHLGISGPEEQRMKSEELRPTRLPPLVTEIHGSAALDGMQPTISYQGTPASPIALQEKQTCDVQQKKPDLAPRVTSISPKNEAATSVTSGAEVELKKETLYENLKQKNESDSTQKSSIVDKEENNSSPVKLVVQQQGEGNSLTFDKDVEEQHSSFKEAASRRAPVKPAKPSKTTERQRNASPAHSVSAAKEDTEEIAERK